MNSTRLLTFLGLISLGIMGRLVPHIPGFTPLNAIALLGGSLMGSFSASIGSVFATMLITDLMIGGHSTMPFTYFGFFLLTALSWLVKSKLTPLRIPLYSLAGSCLFALISDFGVWLTSGMYEKTAEGLALCYLAGLPFLRNVILGDLSYSILLVAALYGLHRYSDANNKRPMLSLEMPIF